MMYPVFLNLAGKQCLVVGGGTVALRKVISLLRSEARVIVVTTACCNRLKRLENRITLHIRPFQESDLMSSLSLVIGATDNQEVNRTISQRAAKLNIPCNIVDQPALCSFIVPAQVRRGDITIAISTDGVSPRFSRYLKTVVANAVKPLHGELAAYLGTIRIRIRTELPRIGVRSTFWEALFAADPVEEIRTAGWDAFRSKTERLIREHAQRMETDENK